MKLLTYNFLSSKSIRGVKVGYPLKLNVSKKSVVTQDFNENFIQRLMPKLDWPAVLIASEIVGLSEGLPKELVGDISENHELLQKLHHLLLEINILEGTLECPETGRKFPITDGIPNMLLNEDEV